MPERQPSIFDDAEILEPPARPENPIAHAHDPATSHEAAALHTESGHRQRNADLVRRLVTRHPGRTAAELWARPGNRRRRT